MKKIIKITLISLITLFTVNSFSQGNLQFKRARLESYTFSNIDPSSPRYDTLVVTAGTVLKITSASLITTDGHDFQDSYILTITINDHSVVNYNSRLTKTYAPIWLGAGTYSIKAARSYSNSSTIFSFSGIEFNVVP